VLAQYEMLKLFVSIGLVVAACNGLLVPLILFHLRDGGKLQLILSA